MIKALLFLSFFSLDTLPPEALLFDALDSFYQQETIAELSEFQSTKKGNWLKFLPSVGITYTLDGKPRPSASWSSNLIYTSQKNKEKRAAKQRSIVKKNELDQQSAKLKLKALLQDHDAMSKDIEFAKSMLAIDLQLYEVKQDQAQHLEIGPTELLKETQSFRKKEYAIFQKENELQQLESQILIAAHYIH